MLWDVIQIFISQPRANVRHSYYSYRLRINSNQFDCFVLNLHSTKSVSKQRFNTRYKTELYCEIEKLANSASTAMNEIEKLKRRYYKENISTLNMIYNHPSIYLYNATDFMIERSTQVAMLCQILALVGILPFSIASLIFFVRENTNTK